MKALLALACTALMAAIAASTGMATGTDCLTLKVRSLAHPNPTHEACAPFTNPQRVIRYVKSTLVYNGYRPSTQIWQIRPNELEINGIQDGVQMGGNVQKTGDHQIAITLSPAPTIGHPSFPATQRINVNFTV